jgi:hypothetical protein
MRAPAGKGSGLATKPHDAPASIFQQQQSHVFVPKAISVVWRPTFREKLVDQSRSVCFSPDFGQKM